jgi:hypothetical protein
MSNWDQDFAKNPDWNRCVKAQRGAGEVFMAVGVMVVLVVFCVLMGD